MKIAVCDDDARDLARIKGFIEELSPQLEPEPETEYFRSGEELLSAAENGMSCSLVILDIYMKELDGITAARRLKTLLPDVQAAFLSSSRDFAVDAFGLDAVHYLVKPVTREDVKELMERFYARIRTPMKSIELKSRSRTYTFTMNKVQKILSGNKGVDVYILGGGAPIHIPESFAAIEEQLDPKMFLKISRGLIVNMSCILCIDKDVCRLRDGTEALVSRKEKEEIRRRYNDYLFG